jgi:hypothetical protein
MIRRFGSEPVTQGSRDNERIEIDAPLHATTVVFTCDGSATSCNTQAIYDRRLAGPVDPDDLGSVPPAGALSCDARLWSRNGGARGRPPLHKSDSQTRRLSTETQLKQHGGTQAPYGMMR